MKFSRLPAIAILVGALTACTNSAQSITPAVIGTDTGPTANAKELASWHRELAQIKLPGAGCYQASYPSTAWQTIACVNAPRVSYPLPKSRRPHGISPDGIGQSVGNGADFTADTTPSLMSSGIGAFPTVTGVTSVKSVENPEFGCCGENGTNSYTLQLNSYFFTTSACGNIPNCAGWEQFVYENPPGKSKGDLFIQDWLIPTAGSGLSGCPPGKGWEFADGGCVQNSPKAVAIPNISIKSLGSLIETGTAASSGDSVFLANGNTEYGMQNIQGDGITDLSAHWEGAEFNVIGNAGGDIAKFNKGATITVSLQTDTGSLSAPTCPANSGTTGESNNLSFITAPSNPPELQYPSIEFTMSDSSKGSATCDTVPGS
jgi:hypothetical protein